MFDPSELKRPSPETFEQNVTLKKPCLADAPTPNGPGTQTCLRNRPVTHTVVGFIPPYPVLTSEYLRSNHTGFSMPEDHTLLNESIDLVTEKCIVSDDAFESFHRGSSLVYEEGAIPEVCLGVILVTVTSTSRVSETDQFSPVDLEAFGDCVKIRMQSSGKYMGLIRSRAIRQLLDEKTVQLNATLEESSTFSSPSGRKSAQSMSSQDYTARIVIVGAKQEQLRIGMELSTANLFLQHPYAEECGDLEYANPHYLLRPGATMPTLQKSAKSGAPQAPLSGALNETNRNRIMQMFDVASLDIPQRICSQIFTSPRLRSDLKRHQVKAVAMMVEREGGDIESCQFPSMWETTRFSERSKRYRNAVTGLYSEHATLSMGGLLADDMGLGKTLSTLSLICLSLDVKNGDQDIPQTTLVVTTKSTLPGWEAQINQHIHHGQLRTAVYHGSNRHLLSVHFNERDLILTTYETLRTDYEAKGPLYESQWHRVVLDEAHHIRNRKSQSFIAACAVKSTFRWCLTGTPVHNSLDDYGALLSFLGVHGFNSKATFDYWITKPIQEKELEGFSRLQMLVKGTCLRRTKESVGDALDLPPRREEIEFVTLHPQDEALYDFFKKRAADLASGVTTPDLVAATRTPSQSDSVLSLLNFLRLTCDHGQQILPESALKIWNARDRTTDKRHEDGFMVNSEDDGAPVFSAKVLALLKNLMPTHTSSFDTNGIYVPVKSVVFSYWTKMLDLIQQALSTYSFGHCRIDGSTSIEGRRMALKKFNEDPECSVMLATIGSAGEGLDLTVANHVHIIEPHWNPMAEAQAVDRVYRIGQRRAVTITRYIVPNSIETYIQWVQQQKLKLISKIVDTETVTQVEIDAERWKQLRENLGCIT